VHGISIGTPSKVLLAVHIHSPSLMACSMSHQALLSSQQMLRSGEASLSLVKDPTMVRHRGRRCIYLDASLPALPRLNTAETTAPAARRKTRFSSYWKRQKRTRGNSPRGRSVSHAQQTFRSALRLSQCKHTSDISSAWVNFFAMRLFQ
jgi:hypothetical protein